MVSYCRSTRYLSEALEDLGPVLLTEGVLPLVAKLESAKGAVEAVPVIGKFFKLLDLVGMNAFWRVVSQGKVLQLGGFADKVAALDASVREACGIGLQKYPQALDALLEFGPQAIDELTTIMSRFNTTPNVLLNLLSKEGMSVAELKNLLKLEGADPEILLKYFNEGKAIEEIKALLGNTPGRNSLGIPDDWLMKPSKKGGGSQYVNPNNTHDRVRVMPGNPNSPNPAQQRPYVIRQQNGKFFDKNGNEVPGDSVDAHIPLSDFRFF